MAGFRDSVTVPKMLSTETNGLFYVEFCFNDCVPILLSQVKTWFAAGPASGPGRNAREKAFLLEPFDHAVIPMISV